MKLTLKKILKYIGFLERIPTWKQKGQLSAERFAIAFFCQKNQTKSGAIVLWLLLLCNFIQQNLNSSSMQIQILLMTCQRFMMAGDNTERKIRHHW